MCILLSEVYIQENSCAFLDYVDNCDTGGNWNIYLIYLCEYINRTFLFLQREIILPILKT